MATSFSCEHCGNLLTAEGGPGRLILCPRCRRRTEVPAGLAGLPAPHLPGHSPPSPARQDFSPGEPDSVCGETASVRKMAAAMPWVISAMAHVAVGLALMLLVCIVINPADARPPPKPTLAINNTPNPPIYAEQWAREPQDDERDIRPQQAPNLSDKELPPFRGELEAPGLEALPLSIMGAPPGSGPDGGGRPEIGPPRRRNDPFPPGGAANIVYVVDRSGSMHKTFGIVREDMTSSIVRLVADEPGEPADDRIDQWFHVILFADGEPIEHDPRRLVPATTDNKASACTFLQEVRPGGQTDPVPALRRAFASLGRAADPTQGTMMFLLTDGDFPDNQEVLDTITKLNRNKTVMINTILFGRRTADSEQVMRRIADENGGWYKFVSLDEIQGDIR